MSGPPCRVIHAVMVALVVAGLPLLPSGAASCSPRMHDRPEDWFHAIYDLDAERFERNITVQQARIGGWGCAIDNRYAFDGDRFFVIDRHDWQNGTTTAVLYDGDDVRSFPLPHHPQDVALRADLLFYTWIEDLQHSDPHTHEARLYVTARDIASGNETIRASYPPDVFGVMLTGRYGTDVRTDTEGRERLYVYDLVAERAVYENRSWTDLGLPEGARLLGVSDERLYFVDHDAEAAWFLPLPPREEPAPDPVSETMRTVLGDRDDAPPVVEAPFVDAWDRVAIDGDSLYFVDRDHPANETVIHRRDVADGSTTAYVTPLPAHWKMEVRNGDIVLRSRPMPFPDPHRGVDGPLDVATNNTTEEGRVVPEVQVPMLGPLVTILAIVAVIAFRRRR